VVIPNGVDCEKFSPDSAARTRARNELGLGTKFTWIAVGRIEAVKDYPTMLRSFSVAQLAHPEAVLLIAGDGVLRPETERLAASLGLQSSVRFLGIRNDISYLLNAADALVLSSKWEGLPLVLLEAAACGLPVVATDVGGNSEIVCHGRTGFLVQADDQQTLASAMESMMDACPENRIGMGAEGRARVVASFGLDAVVSQWEELYRAAIEGRASLESSTIEPYRLA
jgi:glycosyltransferase involved in cell wall biosynthesis